MGSLSECAKQTVSLVAQRQTRYSLMGEVCDPSGCLSHLRAQAEVGLSKES